ncbi:MAG TPA: DUF971 domain-containing protein [Candidatus Acidoferrum sp.]|nr:DUF971 domain-containing protein [Candidatus Acidoferrum sp.]
MSDRSTPTNIHADRTAGTLRLDWADGHVSTFDSTTLRWLCPCAFCRGEAGLPGWLDSAPTLTADQTRLVDMQLVGQYAVMPTWGDGHHTGYYTYALLRDRCPCPECTTGRIGTRGATPVEARVGHADHAPSTATTAIAGTATATPKGSRP